MTTKTLNRYHSRILRFPILTVEQEQDLVRRWRQNGDRQALEQLIGSHLRLVVRIARDFQGYGFPQEDLIAAGNLGLMEAAQRFDPERGVRFATYALWWIRAAIQAYVIRNWSLVKIGTTIDQKKLFFHLRQLKARLKALEEGDLSPEQVARIAQELEVPSATVIAMNRRMTGADISLNETVGSDTDLEWLDRIIDEGNDPETKVAEAEDIRYRRRQLARALAALDERERRILIERRLKELPTSLNALGQALGISGERIRQIETRALEKMRRMIASESTPAAPPKEIRLAA